MWNDSFAPCRTPNPFTFCRQVVMENKEMYPFRLHVVSERHSCLCADHCSKHRVACSSSLLRTSPLFCNDSGRTDLIRSVLRTCLCSEMIFVATPNPINIQTSVPVAREANAAAILNELEHPPLLRGYYDDVCHCHADCYVSIGLFPVSCCVALN